MAIRQQELRSQLKELTAQRSQLQEQRAAMSAARGAALDARIAAIDARSGQLEQQLFATNDAITSNLANATPAGQFTVQDAGSIARDAARAAVRNSTRSAALTVVAVVALYAIWRGARRLFRGDRVPAISDNSAQLARLQQSVDAIAVEVERISEAQRYTAKLMSERGIGPGEASPVPVPMGQAATRKAGGR